MHLSRGGRLKITVTLFLTSLLFSFPLKGTETCFDLVNIVLSADTSEYLPRMKKSAELFGIDVDEFSARLKKSGFTPEEYYERVEMFKTRESAFKNPDQFLKESKRLLKAFKKSFGKNINEYLNLTSDFNDLKILLKSANSNKERASITLNYAIKLPIEKLRKLYGQFIESFKSAIPKITKKVIQTRLVRMPDFKKVVGTSLAADNGSLLIMHYLRYGMTKLESLSVDLGAFSVLEVILSMTTVKEAAYLEAFPHLLKKGKEIGKNLSSEDKKKVLAMKTPLQKLGHAIHQTVALVKKETPVVTRDGISLGIKSGLISLLPVVVGNRAVGMTGAELMTETLFTTGLISVFFATSSNFRYQLVNRVCVPALKKAKTLAEKENLRTSLIMVLNTVNVVLGSYTWLWYKDRLAELRGIEENQKE